MCLSDLVMISVWSNSFVKNNSFYSSFYIAGVRGSIRGSICTFIDVLGILGPGGHAPSLESGGGGQPYFDHPLFRVELFCINFSWLLTLLCSRL